LMEYGTMGLSLKKDLPGFPWYVKYVLDGGAAQRYGAKEGDILNTIDGHPIVTTPIATIYHMLCGRRGEVRTLGINRGGKDMFLRIQLISVYDIGTQSSEYIEYYWFLLYNGYITNEQYAKLAKPWERYLH
ncbi:MAG TPA: PDZ domain-containing protein, partial [Candidatus Melainabacteria bacterium]|nr:PDZ domain-containing protein [Candidatus Melainabacteria bacterium]